MSGIAVYLLSPTVGLLDKASTLFAIIGIGVSIFAFGFIIFLIIAAIKWHFKPKTIPKCQVCQKLEPDMLSQGKEHWFLCRKHLWEKYSELFPKNTFRVVMAEFVSDSKSKASDLLCFSYYTFWYYKGYIGKPQPLRQLLDSIDLYQCAKCAAKARVLFVNKEDAVWEGKYIIPSTQYLAKGHYLCNKHVLDRVEPTLKAYPKPIIFDGGVWLPYKEDGFQRADEP